mgnify:FL=1
MKAVQGNIYKIARVVLNTTNKDRHQWAKIVVDGSVRHTGQTTYIKKLAKERYNLNVNI